MVNTSVRLITLKNFSVLKHLRVANAVFINYVHLKTGTLPPVSPALAGRDFALNFKFETHAEEDIYHRGFVLGVFICAALSLLYGNAVD